MVDNGSETKMKMRILLVGREGNGKSSCVKTIEMTRQKYKDNTVLLQVVDIPVRHELFAEECTGVGDLGNDREEDIETVIGNVSNKVSDTRGIGPIEAIALVIKYSVRFTKQEKDAVEVVKLMFGDDVFSKHGIIIMTYGDEFYKEVDGRSFTEWYNDQTGDIQKLFTEVNFRIALLDNKTDNTSVLNKQYDKLCNIVQQVSEEYGEDQFKKAKPGRDKLIKREKPEKTFTPIDSSEKTANSRTCLEKSIIHKERFFIFIYWLIFLAILILCVLCLVGKIDFYHVILILVICGAFWIVLNFTFKHFRHRPYSDC